MTPEIEAKKRYLLHWMYDFIDDDDEPAYRNEDVEECDQLITVFLRDIDAAVCEQRAELTWVCARIKTLVFALNDLNRKHAHQLIESNQRDDICDLLDAVLQQSGHHGQGDITAPWRQW